MEGWGHFWRLGGKKQSRWEVTLDQRQEWKKRGSQPQGHWQHLVQSTKIGTWWASLTNSQEVHATSIERERDQRQPGKILESPDAIHGLRPDECPHGFGAIWGKEELLSCKYTLRFSHKGHASGRVGLGVSSQFTVSYNISWEGGARRTMCPFHHWHLHWNHAGFLDASSTACKSPPEPSWSMRHQYKDATLGKRGPKEMRPKGAIGLGPASQAPPALASFWPSMRSWWILD